MDIPKIEFLSGGMEDKQRLLSFMLWLQSFLDALVREIRPGPHASRIIAEDVPKDVLQNVDEAWKEMQEQSVFKKAMAFGESIPAEALQQRGLTGKQLKLKLTTLGWTVGAFGNKQTGGLLGRVLKAIDDVLDSFLGGKPAGHAIMEFKKVLETLSQKH